jgi:hypothetical protein
MRTLLPDGSFCVYSRGMAHTGTGRVGFLKLLLIMLFVLPLLFTHSQRSAAQGPYPTSTPVPTADPDLTCPGGNQGDTCYQTSQCNCQGQCAQSGVPCYGNEPVSPCIFPDWCDVSTGSCQGVSYPVYSTDDCGNCYCTLTNPDESNCSPWGNCS